MRLPMQITFRNIPHSDAVEARVREKVSKLEQLFEKIISCRVVIEAPHTHKHKGVIYQIKIDVSVPDGELVVSHNSNDKHQHEDIYVAIRDAFTAMRRQLQGYFRKQRGDVKHHDVPPHGQVVELIPYEDYGRIRSSDGREIYFHRNSVVNDSYEKLSVGSDVRFVESSGAEGPQASTVQLLGKHHLE